MNNKFNNNSAWYWLKKLGLYILFSLVINHLNSPDSFPGSKTYTFPLRGFLTSMLLCIAIATIAEFNFRHFTKKHFSKKVALKTIISFMASTLGYVSLFYFVISIILTNFVGGEIQLYYFLIGLLLTLLLSFLLIGLSYAFDIYNLYILSIKNAEIIIDNGGKTKKLAYKNIAYFFTENKIVFIVQNNGEALVSNYTLNELEENLNDQLFFRANRQIILHKNAIEELKKIENGKLLILLKPKVKNKYTSEINVSRYKRKEFLTWFK